MIFLHTLDRNVLKITSFPQTLQEILLRPWMLVVWYLPEIGVQLLVCQSWGEVINATPRKQSWHTMDF